MTRLQLVSLDSVIFEWKTKFNNIEYAKHPGQGMYIPIDKCKPSIFLISFLILNLQLKNSCAYLVVPQICCHAWRSTVSMSHFWPFCYLQALDEFVRKTFNEWTSTVDKEATRLLEIPLMRRSLDRSGTLDLNFDRLIFPFTMHVALLLSLYFLINL